MTLGAGCNFLCGVNFVANRNPNPTRNRLPIIDYDYEYDYDVSLYPAQKFAPLGACPCLLPPFLPFKNAD
jgi:hypothetical protein